MNIDRVDVIEKKFVSVPYPLIVLICGRIVIYYVSILNSKKIHDINCSLILPISTY